MKPLKLLYIEWADAFEFTDGWMEIEEAIARAQSTNWIVHMVGWVLEENKEYLLFSPAWTEDGGFTSVLKLPKPWILRRVDLKIPPPKRRPR